MRTKNGLMVTMPVLDNYFKRGSKNQNREI